MANFVNNIEMEQRQISRLRDRYWRGTTSDPDGSYVHHGDCNIFALLPVCTCGLLHDLNGISEKVRDKVYPKFKDDLLKQTEYEKLSVNRFTPIQF